MDVITQCGEGTVILLIRWLCVRVAPGVQPNITPGSDVDQPPEIDLERFLSMIRFDTRGKLDDLPDF